MSYHRVPAFTPPEELRGFSGTSLTTVARQPKAMADPVRIKLKIGKRFARKLGRIARWEHESALTAPLVLGPHPDTEGNRNG